MMNTARKQARSVVIGHSVKSGDTWDQVIGTRHEYSYNNPSRRKTVAEVTLKLASGSALRVGGCERVVVGW